MIRTWLRRVRFDMYIEWPSVAIDPIFTERGNRLGGGRSTPADVNCSLFLAELTTDAELLAAGVSVVSLYKLTDGTCGACFESTAADDEVFKFVRDRMLAIRRRFVRYYRPGAVRASRDRECALV